MKNLLPIILILPLFFTECKIKKDSQPDFESEVQVINQLFTDITEEMRVYYGKPIHPPPPRPIRKEAAIIGYDSTLYKERMARYQEELNNFKIDPKSQLLAVSDSMRGIKTEDLPLKRTLPSEGYIQPLRAAIEAPKSPHQLPLESITNTGYFYLRYSSTFKSESDFWLKMYEENCRGVIYFSRIYFDESLSFGIFECSYALEGENGHGGIIFIRKVNGKWEIEKYINKWIS